MNEMPNGCSASNFKLEEIEGWFLNHGSTDVNYLRGHFNRFRRTFEICSLGLPTQARILDIGCHWLHQAYFFSQRGHEVTGVDAPNTLGQQSVQRVATDLKINLKSYTRLDLGQGLADLPSDYFDQIVFAEIIEHLAFNPIVLWKQIYRVLKPGGRILVTTPNGLYYKSVAGRLVGLVANGRYGIGVPEIFSIGTYGHHWKEFSLSELLEYFSILSSDFEVGYKLVESFGSSAKDEEASADILAAGMAPAILGFDLSHILSQLVASGNSPYGNQIYLNVHLKNKSEGINFSPPWLVE